jgi:hypothetical protein
MARAPSISPNPSVLNLSRLELVLPQPKRRKLADKILIQLIEADIETGFALVDEAKAYRASGQAEFGTRALHDAGEIVADIKIRLQRLGDSESGPFHPLITELRNEIAAAEHETS